MLVCTYQRAFRWDLLKEAAGIAKETQKRTKSVALRRTPRDLKAGAVDSGVGASAASENSIRAGLFEGGRGELMILAAALLAEFGQKRLSHLRDIGMAFDDLAVCNRLAIERLVS